MAGRRPRKRIVGKQEDADQDARHEECARLEPEMHTRWRRGDDPQEVVADEVGYAPGTEASVEGDQVGEDS